MDSAEPQPDSLYDVVIIGGALSGASTAILLLRKNPRLRLLIVEKSAQLNRRVGEATVEVSAYFLGRVLGLTQYLNENHLVKQGLRFWFKNDQVRSLDEASELGGRYQVRLPSYQLDRATLDEEVLRRAGDAGAQLLRQATVTDVELVAGGEQKITLRLEEKTIPVRARWVVDASGMTALLARKEGWWRPNTAHPTTATWARWRGVKDWDSRELAEKFPAWAAAVHSIRNTATNHVMGDGWWSWWIPLKGGDVSIGVVFDQRLVQWPQEGATVGERLKNFLLKHPVAREMLADAQFDENDVHWRKNLAYHSTTFAGNGFVLVGDAAGFIDPFYSPGLDWIAFTSSAAAELISAERSGETVGEKIERFNRDFSKSYHSWFEALYRDKYDYMGEFDLMSLALRLDLGLYYLGVVEKPFRYGEQALLNPPFAGPKSGRALLLMRTYNRRLAKIARRRRRLDLLGRTNRRQRHLIPGFTLNRNEATQLLRALAVWLRLEISEGWRTWWERPRKTESARPALAPSCKMPV